MKKRKEMLNRDVSNRAVIIVLIMVICISIISLGIYAGALNNYEDTPKEIPVKNTGEVSLVIDEAQNNNSSLNENMRIDQEGAK